ncbi:hypothetical protein Nekkels1_17 [Cellulophaga phage Nekkels_1]|uniref:Uncharacterized protein n=1 Tax=Cellulophaga phage Nekkels_1 TaxID=2745692 RepID=A0A8E4UXE9_9CAUD|nr:hypothetical protein M1M31_gp17 [Cellulophaga phage Nekkels_1]QQO97016.1 hypothetical protein Nekkels1_17 [Cellulophaga phage Nekkels_1]QQO97109.1 hypothetical protein Nekkels2_17 [Cellulophaga phage Nekkels_2]
MELTGKCEEEFIEWYESDFSVKHDIHKDGNSLNHMPKPFRWGVYQQYFDSVKIGVESCASIYFKGFYSLVNGDESYIFNTRSEAQEEAIEKANELRNKQLNETTI